MKLFDQIELDVFLTEYWQKKPFLFKQALPNFELPIETEELAGLAYEEGMESRLVQENGPSPWALTSGPFNEEDFAKLPETHWTLLLQAVDQFIPELAELKRQFRFIPDWRVDDIMASVSPAFGSVGPHFDYYDVFLLQAEGTRRWTLGQQCDEHTPLLENTQLKILKHFEAETNQDWIVEAGDILYVPPKLAHHGVAQSQCVTLSIGFRALSHGEILDSFAGFMVDQMPESLRYQDPAAFSSINTPAKIQPQVIDQLANVIREMANPEKLADWFGSVMTEPKYIDQDFSVDPPYQLGELQQLSGVLILSKTLDSRMAYHEGQEFTLFANGAAYGVPSDCKTMVETLCNEWNYEVDEFDRLSVQQQHFLLTLLNAGVIELL